jgi:hypothetical protein
VLAVKRALAKADCYSLHSGEKLTDQLGRRAEAGIKKFQATHSLPPDGVYGVRTHRKLMGYFDAYGALLMSESPPPVQPPTLRQKVLGEALWGYNNRASIHYAQVRPMQTVYKGHSLPQTLDCSEFATVCYKRAGAADPNRMLFNGFGYTGSLSQQGVLVASSQARIGDLVFYGTGWPWHHVAVYAGFGKVVSHGSEQGPLLCTLDYRSDRGAIRSYLP